jgi:hypothetical protein
VRNVKNKQYKIRVGQGRGDILKENKHNLQASLPLSCGEGPGER